MSQIVIRAKMRSRDGDHHGALHDLEAALELSEVEGSRLNVADKLVRIGIEHHAARHMDEAAVWFNRAVDAFEELETIGPSLAGELGRADNKVKLGIQLGEYLSDAGRYAEAVAVLDRCLLETDWLLECAGPVGNPELLGRAREFKSRGLYSLAQARASLGSFELALGTAREALDWANEVDDEASRAAAYHGIAQAAMELALFPDAVEAASRDVEIQRRRGDGRDIAIALNTLAEVDLRSGDHDGAAEARREALEVLEEAARKGDVRRSMSRANLRLRSMILAGLADAERNAGHLDEALAEYRQSLEIDERTGEVLGAVATRTMMAYVTLRLDRADEALGLARHAWQDSAALQSHPSRVGAGHVLALCLMNARSIEAWTEASNVLLEVCAMIDRMRRGIRDEGLRALQSMSRSDPYDLLITCLSTLAKMTGDAGLRRRTFEAVERAKARSLIEAIAGEAEQKARAAGVELGGITQYIQDERENLPRLRFEDIQAMLAAEAEGQGKW
jgi:tetratricopeptide (TPR) repeat protein